MSDHVVQLRYYNDGAENPSSWRDLDGGGTGAFLQPLVARQLGQARHRVWEVRDTSPFPMDVLAAAVLTDLQPGEIPLPLPDGTYRDASRPWTHQDVVNWLPCFAEAAGTRSAHKYTSAPGLSTFASIGTGPHRGICDAEGVLYVVSGSNLYRVAVDGTATSLGTIPGTGRVAMTYNQITNGHQLVVAAESSGYVYNSYTSTLTQITDDGFAGFVDCDFLNQYIVGVEPQRKFWYHSDLNDALSYNTLDRYPAETSPDPIVGIRASHNEVLVFGRRTIEPWVNDPENNAAGTAFQLERGSVVERGCASAHTIRRLDNSIFFLGDDGMPYRLDGYTPRPIAPQALVSAWKDCKWERAFAFTYEDNGHVIYYLTFPDGQTWGYDVAASAVAGHSVWHRRQSFEFDRWRLNTLVKSNGKWYGGDFQTGKLYRVEWGSVYEGCELMPRSFKTGVLHNGGLPVTVSAFRLTATTGGPRSSVEAAVPPAITGALPDGMVGDVVSYQYTVHQAFPGQQVTLTINGTFPPGLTMDATGLVTGTLTTSGSYAFSITPSSECGDGDRLQDAVVVSDSVTSAIVADAPILYWPLHETGGTTITDFSGYNRNGTVTGSPTLSSSGITLDGSSGQGVYYPGNVAGSVLDVGADNGWAIEAVVTRAGNGGSVWEHIAGQFRSPNFGYVNSLLSCAGNTVPADRGKPQGYFSDSVAPTNSVAVLGPSALTTGARVHLMVVRKPPTGGLGTMEIYENGTLIASNTMFTGTSVGIASNGAKFIVGSDADTSNYFPASYQFHGKIEHVAVYDKALSADRVLYHAQVLGLA